jgi:signal transduction histidine kinase
MAGENNLLTNRDGQYLEMVYPVTDSAGMNVTGVICVISSCIDIIMMKEQMRDLYHSMTILFIALGMAISFVVSVILTRQFKILKKNVQYIADGHTDEQLKPYGYRELQELTGGFNDILVKAQTLEASRQEFVSNVSHELKTPMTSIKVLAESLLCMPDADAELYREFMEDIVAEIDRENIIITDLLNLVKMDKKVAKLNVEKININELIDSIIKRLNPIAANREIEIGFEPFRPVIAEVDQVKLTLAISNLIENGIKYNKDNGWVRIYLNADHKYFYLKVEDTGEGIDEANLEHIFERFYRVDKARSRETGGTGLGLAITREVILLHKGAVKVHSVPGEGTTFSVRIPLKYMS